MTLRRYYLGTVPTLSADLFRASVDIVPSHPDALGHYASLLHRKLGNQREAERCYKLALEAERDHVINLGNYGGFLQVKFKLTMVLQVCFLPSNSAR